MKKEAKRAQSGRKKGERIREILRVVTNDATTKNYENPYLPYPGRR